MIQRNQNVQEIDSLMLFQFYAEWCAPCKVMMPVVNTLKVKLEDWLNVHQVDVDQQQELAVKYGIRSVPTFVVLKNNTEIWRSSGVLSEDALEQKLISLK
jgi:thioredoxin 1